METCAKSAISRECTDLSTSSKEEVMCLRNMSNKLHSEHNKKHLKLNDECETLPRYYNTLLNVKPILPEICMLTLPVLYAKQSNTQHAFYCLNTNKGLC